MFVKTSLGYTFETDDPAAKVGKRIVVPPPPVGERSTVSDRVMNFMAQMYGRQKEWNQKKMGRFAAPDGLHHFPDYILNLDVPRLKTFLTKFCSVNATLAAHYSRTSDAHTPEVWMKCKHETLARELQYLWHRVGVRTRVTYRKQMGKWLVLNSGSASYLQIRELLMNSKNPNLVSRAKKIDRYVPLKFRVMDTEFTDRVVEISDTPFDSDSS